MTHNQPIRLLHFADAHIDMANYGRHDPLTSLPVRVMDFLRALNQVVQPGDSGKGGPGSVCWRCV